MAMLTLALPGIAYAEPDSTLEQWRSKDYKRQSGLDMVNAAKAYSLGFTGKGVTVGYLDSGIEAKHPEFAGAIAGGFDFNSADFGDIFGDIFGDFFGGGRRTAGRSGPSKGANVRASVQITFMESVTGCEKELFI